MAVCRGDILSDLCCGGEEREKKGATETGKGGGVRLVMDLPFCFPKRTLVACDVKHTLTCRKTQTSITSYCFPRVARCNKGKSEYVP